MLKVNINKGELYELQVSGVLPEIGAEVLSLIGMIYNKLDKDSKREFKENMTELLPVCFMSNEEKSEFLKKGVEENLSGIEEDDVDSLIDKLDELKNVLKELKKDEAVGNKA